MKKSNPLTSQVICPLRNFHIGTSDTDHVENAYSNGLWDTGASGMISIGSDFAENALFLNIITPYAKI
jgi:hypothetical protein